MSVKSVRNSSIIGYSHTRHTGLIYTVRAATGAFIESHREVPVLDLSTQVLGHAAGVAAGAPLTQPYAANDRELNTGV
jgi:hypothetical protein